MNRTKLILIILLLTMNAISIAADWPHWRGPDYTGISKETDWDPAALNTPTIVWKAVPVFPPSPSQTVWPIPSATSTKTPTSSTASTP
ncbi:MAG: hypothetical protein ACYTER_07100 [Planctomycetota bacterium]|jgi:hypothetical protein